jgi:hypothetical protein
MAGSERLVEAECDSAALEGALQGTGRWLACQDVNTGWAFHVNLAQVARLERAAS